MKAKKNEKKYRFSRPSQQSNINRQTIGFILLLLVFAILLYTVFIMYNEGSLFKSATIQNGTKEQNPNTGMTTVSIVYKNNSKPNTS